MEGDLGDEYPQVGGHEFGIGVCRGALYTQKVYHRVAGHVHCAVASYMNVPVMQ